MNWINKETSLVRGVRVAFFTASTLVVGFAGTVWNVPGVPEAVHNFAVKHGQDLLSPGVFMTVVGGIISFLYNYKRSDVPNV